MHTPDWSKYILFTQGKQSTTLCMITHITQDIRDHDSYKADLGKIKASLRRLHDHDSSFSLNMNQA